MAAVPVEMEESVAWNDLPHCELSQMAKELSLKLDAESGAVTTREASDIAMLVSILFERLDLMAKQGTTDPQKRVIIRASLPPATLESLNGPPASMHDSFGTIRFVR